MDSYLYIALPFMVWAISQTIKFVIRLYRKGIPHHLKGVVWTYVWASGPPSTHTAILTSSLFVVWHSFGLSPIFTFCLAVNMLWLFDMVERRKRQQVLNGYFARDNSETLKKIVDEGYMLDLSGHTVLDIFLGALLGISLGAFAAHWI